MPELRREALLPYPQAAVFDLVNNIERYPEFLPGCVGAEVLEASGTLVRASVHARARGFEETFTTRNTVSAPSRIDLQLEDGPFARLSGSWHFKALGDAGCKVALHLDYELAGVLGTTLKPLMSKAADRVLEAFVQRAAEQLG